MNCHACTRRTLSSVIRSFGLTGDAIPQPPRFSSAARQSRDRAETEANAVAASERRVNRAPEEGALFRVNTALGTKRRQSRTTDGGVSKQRPRFETETVPNQRHRSATEPPKPFATNKPFSSDRESAQEQERPPWQLRKAAMKEKLAGAPWDPRKKLSPDTMEGIRHLHNTQPEKFTLPLLVDHFKVSPEAIRRILRSRWQPTDAEHEDRMRRWDKRGERIWSNLVELGIKPPKKWREMGVGRAKDGQKPRWKTGSRNSVPVNDSPDLPIQESVEHLIPIVDGKSWKGQQRGSMPLSERLGL